MKKHFRVYTSLTEQNLFDRVQFISVLFKCFWFNITVVVDITNFSQDIETDKKKCYLNQNVWSEVLSDISSNSGTGNLNSQVFPCVFDAFHWIVGDLNAPSESMTSLRDVMPRADHVQVFVTGSLYLVGMVLSLLKEVDRVNE